MNNSLSSTIISLYTLILLYCPSFLFSPIILTSIILLLHLLRLGASQKPTIPPTESDSVSEPDPKRKSEPVYEESFVEWDVRAPLEVIYEESEGEDAEENDSRESQRNIIQKYASLSLFYPESDSDGSSEGDFQMNGDWRNMCFRWEEEDDREGLIEIELDDKRSCEVDEENLIEIDLSPAR